MFNFIFNKESKSPDNIYITGDLNLQSYRLMVKLDMRKIINSHIIVLGNFGIGQLNNKIEYNNLTNINNKLVENNNKLYLLRGNLDDEKIFKKYNNIFSNIKFTENLEIVKIENINFLFIGGSITYDRSIYFDHFREKISTFNSIDIPYNKKINIILSHENVDFIYPYNFNNIKINFKYDKWLLNDVKKDRKKLSEVYNILKNTRKLNITHWYSSKHDVNKIEEKNNVKFIQLKKLNIEKLII